MMHQTVHLQGSLLRVTHPEYAFSSQEHHPKSGAWLIELNLHHFLSGQLVQDSLVLMSLCSLILGEDIVYGTEYIIWSPYTLCITPLSRSSIQESPVLISLWNISADTSLYVLDLITEADSWSTRFPNPSARKLGSVIYLPSHAKNIDLEVGLYYWSWILYPVNTCQLHYSSFMARHGDVTPIVSSYVNDNTHWSPSGL